MVYNLHESTMTVAAQTAICLHFMLLLSNCSFCFNELPSKCRWLENSGWCRPAFLYMAYRHRPDDMTKDSTHSTQIEREREKSHLNGISLGKGASHKKFIDKKDTSFGKGENGLHIKRRTVVVSLCV